MVLTSSPEPMPGDERDMGCSAVSGCCSIHYGLPGPPFSQAASSTMPLALCLLAHQQTLQLLQRLPDLDRHLGRDLPDHLVGGRVDHAHHHASAVLVEREAQL